jgi:hypothetical protein
LYGVAGKEGQKPTNNIRLEKDSNYALLDGSLRKEKGGRRVYIHECSHVQSHVTSDYTFPYYSRNDVNNRTDPFLEY